MRCAAFAAQGGGSAPPPGVEWAAACQIARGVFSNLSNISN